MMKSVIVFAMMIPASAVFASDSQGPEPKRVILTLKGQPENAEQLKKRYKADFVGSPDAGPHLTNFERDEMFVRAGFTPDDLKTLDQMERDLIVRNLKFGSWETTKKKYARFSEAKLQALKKLADQNKNLVWR